MSGRVLVALGVAAGVVAAAALVALVTVGGGPESAGDVARRDAAVRPTVRASFARPVHAFGDPVEATLELIVRDTELNPATVRANSTFDPYEVVAAPRREVLDVGDLTVVRYTLTLRCLKEACLPQGGQPTQFDFGRAGFSFSIPTPPGTRFEDRRFLARTATGAWPPLTVVSRLSSADVNDARWRSGLATLPEPGWRIAPAWLVGILLGAAVALVAAAAALLVRWARERRRQTAAAAAEAERPAPPLEQALQLVASTNGDDPASRRTALETLAAELRRHDATALAERAERLAWSESPPVETSVEALTAAVRATLDGGRP
ncbi:MAG TPA: hypothetical protein VFR43_13570 [Gaiellaceae bacterium]|nr:hypothetical protein [Gaiellaceae bacterium]